MKPAVEIVMYRIVLTKKEYEEAIATGKENYGNTDFMLGYILSKAQPTYSINKDGDIETIT